MGSEMCIRDRINMSEDDPHDVAFETFTEAIFSGHPLERPILGTRESIRSITRDDIFGYWKRRYGVASTVLAVAGNIEHADVVEMAEQQFGGWSGDVIDHEFVEFDVQPNVK